MAIKFTSNFQVTEKEISLYESKVSELNGGTLGDVISITATLKENDEVELEWETTDSTKIERIRRITGYLSGTTDRWNGAKQAEEKERVKHDI